MASTQPVGRPEVTTRAAIEQAAFTLFAQYGFDDTTLDMIAGEVGVSRRTIFRYFDSKNDIPWGEFSATLDGLEEILDSTPTSVPLHRAVGLAIVRFNDFPGGTTPSHLDRMRLILGTATLRAHSVLKYAQWRAVISEYAAGRLRVPTAALRPQLVGEVSLAVALTAYGQWLRDPAADLTTLMGEAVGCLEQYVTGGVDPFGREVGARAT